MGKLALWAKRPPLVNNNNFHQQSNLGMVFSWQANDGRVILNHPHRCFPINSGIISPIFVFGPFFVIFVTFDSLLICDFIQCMCPNECRLYLSIMNSLMARKCRSTNASHKGQMPLSFFGGRGVRCSQNKGQYAPM